jgi:putative hydrolase of the HAD superfamily
MIDTLVFDLGNVIVAHDNDHLSATLAARCTAPDALAVLQSGIAHDRRYGTGEASIADLHTELVERLGYRADYENFLDDWCCHFALDSLMLTAVKALSARYKVMIFSNTNAPHWDYCVGLSNGILSEIEAHLSHEMGVVKPDVSSFETLARRAKITPAKSLFFDDRADNIDGARAAGFLAELFVDRRTFMTDLARHGIV